MNKLLLNLVQLLGPLWRRLGANSRHLQLILETKLIMDSRRRSVFSNMQSSSKKKKETSNQDLMSMLVFFITGLFFMLFMVVFPHRATGVALYFTGWMVFVALTLISDFTDVLIDVRDNYILMPRPVSDRTLALSRLLHIGFYLSKLTLAFAVPGLITVAIRNGILALAVFFILLLISVVLAILLVNLIYLLILRLTVPARFREIINYFQIVFTATILITYYILPRLLDIEEVQDLNLIDNPAAWWLPSVWLGAVWELVIERAVTLPVIGMSVLALLSPVISLMLISGVLANNFSQKLLGIGEGGSTASGKEKDRSLKAGSWNAKWLGRLCPDPVERAAYRWTYQITGRSRDYRLKVYPFFAFIPAYFFFIFFSGDGPIQQKFTELLAGDNYLVLLYLTLFLLTTSFFLSRFSEKFRAAWVYYAMPIHQPGPLITGAFKACAVKFFLPFFSLIALICLVLWGPKVLDDILLSLCNIIFLSLVLGYRTHRFLPFSKPWEDQNRGANLAQGMLTLLLGGVVGGIHYLGLSIWWLPLLMITVIAAMSVWIYRLYFNVKWEQLAG